MMRLLLVIVSVLWAVIAQADFTLQVNSPTEGGFLGFTNQVSFLITNATEQTTVRVTANGPAGPTVITQKFTPDADNKITASIQLNFNESSPNGAYTITVEAFDSTFSATPVVRHVTVDVLKPKILEFNPINNSAVKGPTVPIDVKISEANLKEWRVKVDGNDIPNNTGTTVNPDGTFHVDWNVSGFLTDGNHTLVVSVTDLSENETDQTITVRVDRLPPSISISFPRSDSQVRPNSDFSVIVNITDPNGGTVDVTGVDVIIKYTSGLYLYRVPRVSYQATGSGAFQWTGRVLKKSIKLPRSFKIVVTAVDRAGNVAVNQEVTVNTN